MPVPLIPKAVNILSDNSVPAATTPLDSTKQPPVLSLAINHDPPMSPKEAMQKPLAAYSKIDKAKQQQQQQQYLSHQPQQMKKVARRSSKPIINWLQRKLAGTVRARSVSDGDGLHSQRTTGRPISLKDKHRRSSAPPIPPLPAIARRRSNRSTRHHKPLHTVPSIKRNAISLDDDEDDLASITDDGTTADSDDEIRSSLARESTWSPASEADEDASVRPLPPSSPPSPSPSRSSSSYLSDPRTFKSMAASTKPTTLLSIDLTGGMAHIAQAPPTPTRRIPQYRTHSTGGGSITFSALPSYTIPRGSSGSPVSLSNRIDLNHAALQAPQHTSHHPRNNPRPSSPPLDNASMLTLASSAYAMPNARIGVNALLLSGRGSTADDSMSHISHTGIGDSVSHILLGELDDDRLEADRDQDVDASVRALRPRSSRRASWESEMSRWSARLGGTGGAHGTMKDRSLWTAGSYKTGGNDIDDIDADGTYDEQENETHALDEELPTEEELHADFGHLNSLHETNDQGEDLTTPPATKSEANVFRITPSISAEISNVDVKKDKSMDTPKGAPIPLSEPEAMPIAIPVIISHASDREGDSDRDDVHSVANTDGLPDVWHSVPSTPMT